MHVKSSGMAAGLANAQPRGVQNLQLPHPATDKAGKCPAVAGGGGGGGCCAQLDLIDALQTSYSCVTRVTYDYTKDKDAF